MWVKSTQGSHYEAQKVTLLSSSEGKYIRIRYFINDNNNLTAPTQSLKEQSEPI